ncbi:YbaB/EbfC family DNA-binding protein [Nonomuraea sp. NPDC002799]
MQEFGDFAKIDLEKLVKGADRQLALLEEFQANIGSVVGRAEDENGFVIVEYGQEGVRELQVHPKAMRLSSGELADLIKIVLQEATADFQRRLSEEAGGLFGADNPMKTLSDPEAATAKLKGAESLYDQAFVDVMGKLDGIRRRMDL